MTTLRQLEAKFIKRVDDHSWRPVETIGDADGIMLLCPKCFTAHKGPIGTHSIVCWRPHVPAGIDPGPGRWELVGAGLDDLTLMAASSSIQIYGGCRAHFHITDGKITGLT